MSRGRKHHEFSTKKTLQIASKLPLPFFVNTGKVTYFEVEILH